MSPTLYIATLTIGVILGWQGTLATTTWRKWRRPRPGLDGLRQTTTPGPGRTIDLTDQALFDWRCDAPDIATCAACRGRGRLWLIEGVAVHCPCGTPRVLRSPADGAVEGPTPPASIVAVDPLCVPARTAGEQNTP